MRSHTLAPTLLALCLASSAPVLAQGSGGSGDEPVRWKDLTLGKAKIQFYGSLRLDLVQDDSRTNAMESVRYVLSEDPAFGARDQGDYTMYPRLTRFGFNLIGPAIAGLNGAVPSGNLEIDFQNGGSESRPLPRIRHAYFKLSWQTLSLLAGQTWDLYSPLFPTVNNDTLMWDAGNMGDRRPQLRLTWEPKAGSGAFSLAGAAGLTGAVDAQDLDGNGVRDGEASGRPDAQARFGYTGKIGPDRKWSAGLSGLYAWQETATPVAGRTQFRSRALNLDYKVPILKWLTVQGEAWTGRDLADFRGGVGQSVNATTGREIASRGGWVEAGFKVSKGWTLYPGYTIDDPRDNNVPAGTTQANAGRTENRAWYIADRWQPDPSFLLGFDFLHWVTEYKAFAPGLDNRINVYMLYFF